MLDFVRNQLHKALAAHSNPHLLLACSGGVDSVVLFDLLVQLNYEFSVAHCNFGLRGDASDADAEFVAALCKKAQIPFYVKQFSTESYADEKQLSIQMAARELRYSWFDELKYTHAFRAILTAHHLNDQLETFMINWGRGTGIKGLRGISSDRILRPLIDLPKADIISYANNKKLSWREDTSNAKDDYLRNALRHHVIPAWEKIKPNLLEQTAKNLGHLGLAQAALEKQVVAFKATHFIADGKGYRISLQAIKTLEPLAYFLHALFSTYGFFQSEDLQQLLKTQSGKALYSPTHRLIRDREELLLAPLAATTEVEHRWIPSKDISYPLVLRVLSKGTASSNTAVLKSEELKYPLILRKYRKGDYFYPVGMNGKKKLSKFFKDEKYSMLEKENQWLLCTETEIIWVIGKRVDARFAALPATLNPLVIQCD